MLKVQWLSTVLFKFMGVVRASIGCTLIGKGVRRPFLKKGRPRLDGMVVIRESRT
jgi:hypothetical protein